MKAKLHFLTLALLVLASSLAEAADHGIDWFTIDGGAGQSTGGVYTVIGTIGQPDAGTMSGGSYTLSGGFWGIVAAVQTAGAPWLTVLRTSTNTVVVAWQNTDPNWKLHRTASLSTPNTWTEIPPPYATSGTNCVFVEPAPTGNKYYRLHNP